jgi:hypothetical protein
VLSAIKTKSTTRGILTGKKINEGGKNKLTCGCFSLKLIKNAPGLTQKNFSTFTH